MVQHAEETFVNARKQKLFSGSWLPDDGAPSAIFLFHHGLGEYILRYKDGKDETFDCFPRSDLQIAPIPRHSAVFPQLVNEAHVAVYSHDYHGEPQTQFELKSVGLNPRGLPAGHGKSEPREEKNKAYIVRL